MYDWVNLVKESSIIIVGWTFTHYNDDTDAFLLCRFDKEYNKEVAIKVIDLEES